MGLLVEVRFGFIACEVMLLNKFSYPLLGCVRKFGKTTNVSEKHSDFTTSPAERETFSTEQFGHNFFRNYTREDGPDPAAFRFFKHKAPGDHAYMSHEQATNCRQSQRDPQEGFRVQYGAESNVRGHE